MARPPPRELQALEPLEQMLGRGELGAAIEHLLKVLDRRGAGGDLACTLAARALRARDGASPFAPDAMATALDRLADLVRRQDAQIRALRALIETAL